MMGFNLHKILLIIYTNQWKNHSIIHPLYRVSVSRVDLIHFNYRIGLRQKSNKISFVVIDSCALLFALDLTFHC